MSLADDLAGIKPKPHSRMCSVEAARRSLPDADAEAFMAAVANLGLPASAIARVLAGHDCLIAGPAINRHRRGECSCRESR